MSTYGPLTRQDTRRVEMFAHKFIAEWRSDRESFAEATEGTMRAAFARCVRPIRTELYPFVASQVAEVRDALEFPAVTRTYTCGSHGDFSVTSAPDFTSIYYGLSAIGASMRAGIVGCPKCNALSGMLAESAPASLIAPDDGTAEVADVPKVTTPAAGPLELSIDGEHVIVTGSVKGDETHRSVLPRPWVWSRSQGGYVLPRSLTPSTRGYRIERLKAECERAGVPLTVEDTGATQTEAERRAARTERLEIRADRHENAAERASAAEASARAAADRIGERFWMGQPILIGHHSEGRARRDQERMHDLTRKAIDAEKEATNRARLAEGIRTALERGDSSVTIGNRIERNEAELRGVDRRLKDGDLAAKVAAERPELAERAAHMLRPISDRYRAQLEAARASLTEAIELDQATLAAMVESGAVRVFDKTTVSKGDMVKIRGQWREVAKANTKTVGAVVSVYADGSPSVLNSPWREVSDHRTAAQVAEMKRVAESV